MKTTLVLGTLALLWIAAPALGQGTAEGSAYPYLAFGGADGTPISVTHDIPLVDSLTIADVHVRVVIDHSWVGDIELELTSPGGTTIVLQSGDGGDADDLNLIYADDGVGYGSVPFDFGCYMQPDGGPLALLAGEDSVGIWTLAISDNYPSSADGVLVSWTIRCFDTSLGNPPPPVLSFAAEPTADGAELTWTNPAIYDSIAILVDGETVRIWYVGTLFEHVTCPSRPGRSDLSNGRHTRLGLTELTFAGSGGGE